MMHHNGWSSMMHWHQRYNRFHGMHGVHSNHRLGDDRLHDLHSGGMMHHMAARDRVSGMGWDGVRVDRFMKD